MEYQSPGIHIPEINAFPTSFAAVATAVPAFVGYTQTASDGNQSLLEKPWRITSMAEFRAYFGEPPTPQFTITLTDTKKPVITHNRRYTLYYHMLFFFANGGGSCYIVSVGDYTNEPDTAAFIKGIDSLLNNQATTMLVIPEAVNLKIDDCQQVQLAMFKHCGCDMRNRVALLDVFNGDKDRKGTAGDIIEEFRERIDCKFLSYGIAYYPWLNTSILGKNDVNLSNIAQESLEIVQQLLTDEAARQSLFGADGSMQTIITERMAEYDSWFKQITQTDADKTILHNTLMRISPQYQNIMNYILQQINCLPVSAAIAGIYTLTDTTRGVWKAAANVSVANAISPTVSITSTDNEELNMDINGKSINAIRLFTGIGILVWGARTLDGNSLNWRYINIRRTAIMLEESIKNAIQTAAFKTNSLGTWVNIKTMINNFLFDIWKQGALMGASPEEAYNVRVGVGETMTPEDILEGTMRITVSIAFVRPAEFIDITLQLQMLKS